MGGLRNTRASPDEPTTADQRSGHPRCDESVAESGHAASSPRLCSVPFPPWLLSSLWSSPAGSPGQSSRHSLGKSSCLPSEGCSRTEGLSFALLCPHLVLSHCVFSLAHASAPPDARCQGCPCAPTAPLPPAACLQPQPLWHPTSTGRSLSVVDFLFSK